MLKRRENVLNERSRHRLKPLDFNVDALNGLLCWFLIAQDVEDEAEILALAPDHRSRIVLFMNRHFERLPLASYKCPVHFALQPSIDAVKKRGPVKLKARENTFLHDQASFVFVQLFA